MLLLWSCTNETRVIQQRPYHDELYGLATLLIDCRQLKLSENHYSFTTPRQVPSQVGYYRQGLILLRHLKVAGMGQRH